MTNSESTHRLSPLRAVTPEDIQKEAYLTDKLTRGLDLVCGREVLTSKQLTKQIDTLSYLFWRGSERHVIAARLQADLARASLILCVFYLNNFPVTDEVLEDNLIPRVLFRLGKKTALSVREIFAFRREVIAINTRIKSCFINGAVSGDPKHAHELNDTGLSEVIRAKQIILAEQSSS